MVVKLEEKESLQKKGICYTTFGMTACMAKFHESVRGNSLPMEFQKNEYLKHLIMPAYNNSAGFLLYR